MASQPQDARETWLNAFIAEARPYFAECGFPLPERIRAAIGFTSSGKRGKSIAECWSTAASEDQHHEIFIKPTHKDEIDIAGSLCHELIHAAVGNEHGHKGPFVKCMKAIGFEGKPRFVGDGKRWREWAEPVIAALGPMPYAPMRGGISSGPKKQGTRLVKLQCGECGWTARVTRVHIDPHPKLLCPNTLCDGELLEG